MCETIGRTSDANDESRGPWELPGSDQAPSQAQKIEGFICEIGHRFRAAMKALTKPEDSPKPRSKRRRSGEGVQGFSAAANNLLGRAVIPEPVARAILYLADTLDWLNMWDGNEHDDLSSTSQDHTQSHEQENISYHL